MLVPQVGARSEVGLTLEERALGFFPELSAPDLLCDLGTSFLTLPPPTFYFLISKMGALIVSTL